MSEEFYGKNLFGDQVNVGLVDESEVDVVAKAEKEFNIFPLTDAIGMRDRKSAWMVYQKALASGMVADEIFWRVMWGVRALLLAEKTKGVEESGLNPFVYRKAKSFLKNWKREELETLSETLVLGYHRARRGILDLEILLERVILSL